MLTLSRKKKLAILIAALVVIAGISAYCVRSYYQEKEQATLSKARTDMIKAQATANNIKLLSDEEIKNITAINTGVDLEALTFKEVSLITFDDLPHAPLPNHRYDDSDETKRPPSSSEATKPPSNSETNQPSSNSEANQPPLRNEATGPASTGEPPVASATTAEKPQIPNYSRTHPNELRKHPLYRIIATSNGVIYDLLIDAVNGHILRSTVR